MESLTTFTQIFTQSPYGISFLVYIIGVFLQIFISLYVMNNRINVLLKTYGYEKHEIKLLYFISVVIWPMSLFYMVKSLFTRTDNIEDLEEE